jgi:hypothetical protein
VGGQAVRYVNQMMTVKIIKFDACYSTARIDWLGFEVADALAYSCKKETILDVSADREQAVMLVRAKTIRVKPVLSEIGINVG